MISYPKPYRRVSPSFPLGFRSCFPTQTHQPVPVRSEKACETLALDLRGYGTHLVAPETPAADDDVLQNVPQRRYPPPQERCATAGATVASRTQRRTMTKSWSSSIAGEGRKYQDNSSIGPAGDSSKPPPFGAVRGTTVQEARITVVTDQVGHRATLGSPWASV